VHLTVLGFSASYPAPGTACAGYLVTCKDTKLLVDCGNGVLSKLGQVTDPLGLDAVVITHAHPDHIADLYSVQAMLRYAPEGPAPPMPLYGPEDLLERVSCLLSEHGAEQLVEAFSFEALHPGVEIDVGAMSITPFAVRHGVETFALRIEGASGTLGYTADSAYCDELVRAALGVDLLVAEATLPAAFAGAAPHMTGSEAGRVASEAGVGRLMLTHLWPTADTDEILREAREVFDGETMLANEFLRIDLP
jgi:ribonuclease BN (tRNA processing enzyme)